LKKTEKEYFKLEKELVKVEASFSSQLMEDSLSRPLQEKKE